MTIRRKRLLLRLVAAVLLLATGGICALDWTPNASQRTTSNSKPTEMTSGTSQTPRQSLTADQSLWKRALRKPIFDPPPPPPPEVVKKELPPIRAKLLGTILEPGNSQAMIAQPGGAVEFRTVGQPLGPQDEGATIVEISSSVVKVKRGEELTTLTVEAGR